MSTGLKVIHWNAAWGPVNGKLMLENLRAAGYDVSRYTYEPGTYFPPHTHAVHKRDTVLSGRLKIAWDGGSVVLEAGDMVDIPAGTSHSAEVIGAEPVLSFDATRSPE